MKIESNRATIDNVELLALAAVGAMALGQKKLAELILKNQFDVEKLNGEIRESCGEFCICQNPSIYVSVPGQPLCANCGKLYIQNSQERTE